MQVVLLLFTSLIWFLRHLNTYLSEAIRFFNLFYAIFLINIGSWKSLIDKNNEQVNKIYDIKNDLAGRRKTRKSP
jgi:hypothetical protein